MLRIQKLMPLLSVALAELVDSLLHAVVELRWRPKVRSLVYIEATLGLAEKHLVVQLALGYLRDLVFIEPLNARAFFPESVFEGLSRDQVGAESVLFATAPVARVGSSV